MSTIIIPKRRMERGNTAANLAALNEVLLAREWCIETDTLKVKIGDGVTVYNLLDYVGELANLADPAADKIVFWDNTINQYAFLGIGSGLNIDSNGNLDASGASAVGEWTMIKKTANESRSSVTTVADDSDLLLALAATTTYFIKWRIYVSIANATMDFKYDLAYSGTTTAINIHRRQTVSCGLASGTDNETTATLTALPTGQGLVGAGSGGGWIEFNMIITTNASGTVSFQWAQNTSDPGNATVLGGSYLEYMTV